MTEDGRAPSPSASQRLDVWLDVACLFKTRSLARTACQGGKVEVNGRVARPGGLLRKGDELRITRGGDRSQIVVVRDFAHRHVAKAVAHALYEDRTPPPSPEELEELEERRLRRTLGVRAPSRPVSKRDRRALRRLKQGG